VAEDLVQQARAGDRDAFAALTGPHRAELLVHCYRMLGSLQDAEDALQETLLSAWLGLEGFEGRSSVRTWLYRVATNRCLNLLRSSSRRPHAQAQVAAPAVGAPGDVLWLQPFPDVLLEDLPDRVPGPEARYESREAISLAFVTAVQLLPPTQRAVLLLRDVLGYRAREVAELLGTSEEAVTSALKRARAALQTRRPTSSAPPGGRQEQVLLDRFVEAFTTGDVEAVIALLTDDVWVRMPPAPFEHHGTAAVRDFFVSIDAHRRSIAHLLPTGANRQPAWGEYVRDAATGHLHLTGVLVLEVDGDRIRELTHFEAAVGAGFGLPRILDRPPGPGATMPR
jgi:RNA polymerase sigma-70 factor (TIGR02960 family)